MGIRIGNKTKSIRIKKYIIEFHATMTDRTYEESKTIFNDRFKWQLEFMPDHLITSDNFVKAMLSGIASRYDKE